MTLKAYGAHDLVDALVDAHWRSVLPGERLFRGVDRWERPATATGSACGPWDSRTTLHDSRHHWAVRMVRAGMPLELVARQLGHKDVVMVARVYGRFVPTSQERDRWEAIGPTLTKKNGVARVPLVVPLLRRPMGNRQRKTPNPRGMPGLAAIAGVGLEPTTPAL